MPRAVDKKKSRGREKENDGSTREIAEGGWMKYKEHLFSSEVDFHIFAGSAVAEGQK